MRRAVVLLLALTALVAGCGGESESGPFATGDAPLDVELGPQRTEGGVVVRQVVYRSGEDRVGAYLVKPASTDGRVPAVLYLHGAGGDREEQLQAAVRLARQGAAGLTITAPSRGKSPPAGATAEETLRWQRDTIVADVVAARRGLDLLADDERVDPERLGLVGWSMGGRLATIAAGVDERVRAVVLMSTGAVPVAEYVSAAPAELKDDVEAVLPDIDPLSHVDDIRGALLVQAARADSVVPQRALQAVIDAAPDDATVEWYATDHALDEQATRDRLAWLGEQLGLGD
ncbi:MAG TPA: alpha/beta fold hydrolase [Gaiella sp.]|nr:alpha/beta fold hydrolase [Gaiella sp.]